jgi:hypothetical protein
VVRRLIASFLAAAFLLGVVQPASACAFGGDCCPAGATGECSVHAPVASSCIGIQCCATHAPAGAVLTAARLRQPAGHAASPAVATVPVPAHLLAKFPAVHARPARPAYCADASLTFLRTGRLRL